MRHFKVGDLIATDRDLTPAAGGVGRIVGEERMGRIKLLVIEWIKWGDGTICPAGICSSHRACWLNSAGFRKVKEDE